MIRFTTAGESHGPALVAIIEGLPAGLLISENSINLELRRRQAGFGRSKRMDIERDKVKILSGVRFGRTLGSPLALLIENKDFSDWKDVMAQKGVDKEPLPLSTPRPGHADLAGLLKFGERDIRNIIERSSARETASRVGVGAVCKAFLKELNIAVLSQVTQIGSIKSKKLLPTASDVKQVDASPVRCFDKNVTSKMIEEIKRAKEKGDTLGGVFEVFAYGVPPGLGSYTSWEKRLDGRIAQALMSIPAIKGVEVGGGFKLAADKGSKVQDEIFFKEGKGFYRKTNRAGGIEGGISNGETIVARAAMKPIPTLKKPLRTVDVFTKKTARALKERADVCAVPSAAVIGEAMIAVVLAKTIKEKFGGDSIEEVKCNYNCYLERTKNI